MQLQRERYPAGCIKSICSGQVTIISSLTPVCTCTPCRTEILILVPQLESKLFNRVKIAILNMKQVLGSPTACNFQAKGETMPLFQIHVFLKPYRADQINLRCLFTLCNHRIVQIGRDIRRSLIQPLLKALNSGTACLGLFFSQVLKTIKDRHNPLGQPVPIPCYPQSDFVPPYMQSEPLISTCACCLSSSCHVPL